MFVRLGDGIVTTDAPVHPGPTLVPGAVAKSWGSCTIPGCRHDPCPAKLRAWAGYGDRYLSKEAGCDHRDANQGAERRRATSPSASPTRVRPCRSTSWTWSTSRWVRPSSRCRMRRAGGGCGSRAISMPDQQAECLDDLARSLDDLALDGQDQVPGDRSAARGRWTSGHFLRHLPPQRVSNLHGGHGRDGWGVRRDRRVCRRR